MSQRHIYLGMPVYGALTPAAARGFWRACADDTRLRRDESDERDVVRQWHSEGSLLGSNFNRLWTVALNLAHSGERVDYFAMLHPDIGPEDFWLDKLIDELEAHDLDMLGVVAPIKDMRGVTSIALEHPDGDTWRPLCRLTMREVYKLPPTFTSEDVGHKLLLNTGCWVCRFDPSWVKKVRFTVNDRIVFDAPSGRYETQCESEDWYFSRLCHELGLKIGCTRKVRLLHRGEQDFANTAPWGSHEFDESVEASVVPQRAGVIRFPFEVDGWLLPEEGEALAELARGKRVLEIGSFCGRSTICLAQTAEHVLAVDYFDGRGTPSPRNTFDEFIDNVNRYGVRERVTPHHPDAAIPLPEYDVGFIDGAHDYPAVKADICKALRVLKPDGVLAFHDYRKYAGQYDGRSDPGVNQAVDELLGAGGELLSTHASLAVVRPPAAIPLEV